MQITLSWDSATHDTRSFTCKETIRTGTESQVKALAPDTGKSGNEHFSMFPRGSPRSPLVSPHTPWKKGERPVHLICVITRKRMLFALRSAIERRNSGHFSPLLSPKNPKRPFLYGIFS